MEKLIHLFLAPALFQYQNECIMKRDACARGKELHIVYDGNCSSGKREMKEVCCWQMRALFLSHNDCVCIRFAFRANAHQLSNCTAAGKVWDNLVKSLFHVASNIRPMKFNGGQLSWKHLFKICNLGHTMKLVNSLTSETNRLLRR